MQVGEPRLLSQPVRLFDQRFADLDPKIVPLGFGFRHSKQESSASAAHIEQQRLRRVGEHAFGVHRLWGLAVIRGERIDVLVYSDATHIQAEPEMRKIAKTASAM